MEPRTTCAWVVTGLICCVCPMTHALGPEDLRWLRCRPPVIRNDGVESAVLEVAVSAQVRSVSMPLAPLGLLVDGRRFADEGLFDDGSHGDRVARDGIFSRGPLTTTLRPTLRAGRLDRFLFDAVFLRSSTEAIRVNLGRGAGAILGIVDRGYAGSVVQDASQVWHSARAVGIQMDMEPAALFDLPATWQQAARRVLSRFGDQFDFLFLFPDRGLGGDETVRGERAIVRSPATGIGTLPVGAAGDAVAYGSPQRLIAVHALPFSPVAGLLRATMRTWAVYLDPAFGFGQSAEADYSGYWGFSSVNGALGGFDRATFAPLEVGSATWTVGKFSPVRGALDSTPYAPLELYLAGLAAPEEVAPILVLDGARDVGDLGLGAKDLVVFSATHEVTVNQIVTRHGARIPPHEPQTPTAFRAAFVLLSASPPNVSSVLFFDALAEYFGAEERQDREHTFATATMGRATMDVVIDAGLLPSPTPTATATAPPGQKGDRTGDGKVDWRDLFALARDWMDAAEAADLLTLVVHWHR